MNRWTNIKENWLIDEYMNYRWIDRSVWEDCKDLESDVLEFIFYIPPGPSEDVHKYWP